MIKIGNKVIGEGRTYVVAEFGVNHNGSLELAKEGIRKAALAGADAIKFQTYKAKDLVVKGTAKFWNAKSKVDEGLDQYQAYEALEGFKDEWYPELIKCCEENEIEFISTPFSFEAADYLNSIGMKAFKVASSDMSCLPYLKHIARFNKPILLSTGASTLGEVAEAVKTIVMEGNKQIVIMQCTLCYPTKIEDANLNAITTLKALEFTDNDEYFGGFEVGLSDHTLGITASIVAAAMGASLVEKHFTTDKTLGKSADHWLSVDPQELSIMVDAIREVETLKGSPEKKVYDCESETRILDKRSIVINKEVFKGDFINEDMLTYKRPGTGIAPRDLKKVLGMNAAMDISPDTTLTWEMLM